MGAEDVAFDAAATEADREGECAEKGLDGAEDLFRRALVRFERRVNAVVEEAVSL